MGTTIELRAADGHKFAAYRADPAGKPRGGIVVIQEIFGVNRHMRRATDGFAPTGTWRSARPCSTARSAGWISATGRMI